MALPSGENVASRLVPAPSEGRNTSRVEVSTRKIWMSRKDSTPSWNANQRPSGDTAEPPPS